MGWNFDKEAFAAGQSTAFGVKDLRLGPMLASIVLDAPALDAQRRSRRYGETVVHFKVARDGGEPKRADGLAHRFVKKRGENAAVDETGRAFVEIGDGDGADDDAVPRVKKVELETAGVGWATAEAAVLRGVGQGREVGAGPGGHAEALAERGLRDMQAG